MSCRSRRRAVAGLVMLGLAGSGHEAVTQAGRVAVPFCASVPRAPWLSSGEVGEKLRERGFEMVQLRLADDRCYAAIVRGPDGRRRDLIVHPVTAEIVAGL